MRNTMIALRGPPDAGKTTAIRLAYEELLQGGESVYTNPRSDATELKEVLEIDGLRVGFVTAGDKPDRLEKTLLFLLEFGCVVIVCAARVNRSGEPSHKTIDAVEAFARTHEFRLKWVEKRRTEHPGRRDADRAAADEIVAEVRRATNRGN